MYTRNRWVLQAPGADLKVVEVLTFVVVLSISAHLLPLSRVATKGLSVRLLLAFQQHMSKCFHETHIPSSCYLRIMTVTTLLAHFNILLSSVSARNLCTYEPMLPLCGLQGTRASWPLTRSDEASKQTSTTSPLHCQHFAISRVVQWGRRSSQLLGARRCLTRVFRMHVLVVLVDRAVPSLAQVPRSFLHSQSEQTGPQNPS